MYAHGLRGPKAFENLLRPCPSEPSASVHPVPAPQGHQQSLVNDNPDVYAALGRGDWDQRGKRQAGSGGTWPDLVNPQLPPLTGPTIPEWSGSATF